MFKHGRTIFGEWTCRWNLAWYEQATLDTNAFCIVKRLQVCGRLCVGFCAGQE